MRECTALNVSCGPGWIPTHGHYEGIWLGAGVLLVGVLDWPDDSHQIDSAVPKQISIVNVFIGMLCWETVSYESLLQQVLPATNWPTCVQIFVNAAGVEIIIELHHRMDWDKRDPKDHLDQTPSP